MKHIALLAFAVMLAGCSGSIGAAVDGQPRPGDDVAAQELVGSSLYTAMRMRQHPKPEQAATIREHIAQAKAVMIFPDLLKGAFFIGGEGGNGVLLARAADGRWSYPAFYGMKSASFGLQIGVQSSSLMLIIRSGKALSAVMRGEFKIGVDAGGAIGMQGEGMEASTTVNGGADIVAYSINKGGFVGISLEGATLSALSNLNRAYYGDTQATAERIVLEGLHVNQQADPLRDFLEKF